MKKGEGNRKGAKRSGDREKREEGRGKREERSRYGGEKG